MFNILILENDDNRIDWLVNQSSISSLISNKEINIIHKSHVMDFLYELENTDNIRLIVMDRDLDPFHGNTDYQTNWNMLKTRYDNGEISWEELTNRFNSDRDGFTGEDAAELMGTNASCKLKYANIPILVWSANFYGAKNMVTNLIRSGYTNVSRQNFEQYNLQLLDNKILSLVFQAANNNN